MNQKTLNLFLFILISVVFLSITACKNPFSEDDGSSIESGYHPGINLSLQKSTIVVSSSTVMSGQSVTFTVQLNDNFGNPFIDDKTIAFSLTGGTSTGTISTITKEGYGKYSATFSALGAGSPVSISATVNGENITSASPTLQVISGNYSLANSVVSIGSSSIQSGNSTTVTLSTFDTGGNPITTGGMTVSFATSGGTSTGTFSSVTDNNDGTYTATFTGVLSGSATSISASIYSNALTSTLPTVTVTPGTLSLAQSAISLSGSSLASGSSITATLTTKDAAGNLLGASGAGKTVVFSNSGGTSTGSWSATSDNSNGTYSATFTGVNSGSATSVMATINASSITSSLPALTVTPGSISLAQSIVSVSSATISSGSSVTLTLTVKDAAGNSLTSGGATVVFSVSGGTSTGTVSSTTDNNNGTYTATFTGTLAGTAKTINATIGGSNVTSTLPTVTVTPGVFNLLSSLVTVSSATLVSGNSLTVTLTAKDAAGNSNPTGITTVSFNASSGSFGTVTNTGNGVYTASYTGALVGTYTITGYINTSAVLGSTGSVTVSTGSVSLAQSVITLSSNTVASGSLITATLTAKDAAGNSLTTGGLTVVFSNTGGTSTGAFSATTDNNNGTYAANFQGTLSGSATSITATIGGASISSTLPTVTVTPGPFDLNQSTISGSTTATSGVATTLTLNAKDAAGNSNPTGVTSVTFFVSFAVPGTGTFGSVTNAGNGAYTCPFTGTTAGMALILAKINGTNIGAGGGIAVTISPGTASQLVFSTQPSNSVNGVNLATSPAVTVKDVNNNIVTSYATAISMSIGTNPGSGSLSGTTSVTPTSGVSTFNNLQIDTAGTGYTLTATSGSLSVTSSTFNVVSYKPTTVTTTLSQPLEYYSIDNTTAITPTYSSATVTAGGQVPALGGQVPTGTPSVSGTGVVPPLAGSTVGSGSSAYDASTSFTATVNVSANLPSGATSACLIQSPFNAVSCLLPSFNISSAQLTTTGNLTVRVYASNGGPLDYLDTSVIPVKRKVIEKFMSGIPTGNFHDMSYGETNESVTLNSKMYFIAANAGGFQKLFVTDGTTITQLPNTCGAETCHDKPYYLTVFNNKVYFIAVSDNSGLNTKLYSTDGVTITQVSNTRNNQAAWDYTNAGLYKAQNQPIVSNNQLLIRLINSNGFSKLYGVDTSGNLTQVSNTKNNNSVSDNVHFLTEYNGNAYFTAANSTGNFRKIYKYDGSIITQISNTTSNNGATDGVYMFPIATSNGLFFWANNSSAAVKLFKYDGTSVSQISNIISDQSMNDSAAVSSKVFAQINLDGKYVFYNQNINSIVVNKIFQTDGTSLIQISNTMNNQTGSDNLYQFRPQHILNGELYFGANNPSGHKKLYKTDGTTVTQVSNINNGATDDAYPIGVFDNDLYFEAKDPSGFYKLYKTNGTEVLKVADFNPGQHDFDDQIYNCNGLYPVFWVSGSSAYISVTNTNTCVDTLYRIRNQ